MTVLFRTDASHEIGSGHVMRCLTLARALRDRGVECHFVSREHPGNLIELVRRHGFRTTALPLLADPLASKPGNHDRFDYRAWLGTEWETDAQQTISALNLPTVDCLVVDHYALGSDWEQQLRPISRFIMAIDDLANRNHVTDVLLDQNLGKTRVDYETLAPKTCKLMIGPQYALLRPEFQDFRAVSLSRRQQGRRSNLLITMGGMDQKNVTGSVLNALNQWRPSLDFKVTVVLGGASPWRDEVTNQAEKMSFDTKVLLDVKNMAELMYQSDIAIGAAGSTSWERCCLGLPTLQIVLAENQRAIAHALSQAGAAKSLDRSKIETSLAMQLYQMTQDPLLLLSMSNAGAETVDGKGTSRVAGYIIEGLSK